MGTVFVTLIVVVMILSLSIVSAGFFDFFKKKSDVQLSAADGLVLYYNFENGNANDVSGYNKHGTNNGAAFVNDPIKGKVASFDGTNDFIKLLSFNGINAKSFTISFWMKSNLNDAGLAQKQSAFLYYNNLQSGMDVYFYQHSSAKTAFTMLKLNPETGAAANFDIDIEPNIWRHITGVYDKPTNTMKLYADGLLVNTKTGIGDVTALGELFIGRSPYGNYFGGMIDDVRIYDRALSQSEINELAGIVSGGGTELCNGVDDDGDGVVDEGCVGSYDCEAVLNGELLYYANNGEWLMPGPDQRILCYNNKFYEAAPANPDWDWFIDAENVVESCIQVGSWHTLPKNDLWISGRVPENCEDNKYTLTCTNIDFNCDEKVTTDDYTKFALLVSSGQDLTQARVDTEKASCANFGNYLQSVLDEELFPLLPVVENKVNECYSGREPPCGSYGDPNDDDLVDLSDMSFIALHFGQSVNVNPVNEKIDLDNNDFINQDDFRLIDDYINGDIDTFPVCSLVCPSGKVLGCPEGFSEITSSSDGGNSNVGSYYTGASCSGTEYAKTPYRATETKLCISINTATPSCRSGKIGANCNSLSVCNIVGLREVKEKGCVEVGCTPGEKMCQGSHYLLCNSNGVFEDKGNVDGYCGVVFHCEDSDGGLSYFVKGETKSSVSIEISDGGGAGGGSTAIDSCSGNVLTEYSCNENERVETQFTCLHGCSDGACLPPPGRGGRAVCLKEQAGGNIEVDPRVRVQLDETPVGLNYCDPRTLNFKPVEPKGASCLNDFECRSNACIDGECVSLKLELERQTNLLNKIWCWIKDVFGGEDYNICIARSGGNCIPNWQVGTWSQTNSEGEGCGVRTVTDANQCGVVCSSVEDVEDCLTLKLCEGLSGED